MTLKKLLFVGAVGTFALQAQAQSNPAWIHDTIATGAGYANNVYYSLEKGITSEADAKAWDLGFSMAKMDAGILTNSADNGILLYRLDVDTAQLGSDLTADFIAAKTNAAFSLYNSNLAWADGAFNQEKTQGNQFNYGWGTYNMTTHLVDGERVYGLQKGTDTFQVYFSLKDSRATTANGPIYVMHIAPISGGNVITKTLALGATEFAGRNYTYYNLADDSLFSREPLTKDWDFVFTNFNNQNIKAMGVWYKTFGLLLNNKTSVDIQSVVDVAFHDTLDYSNLNLSYADSINAMATSWKFAGQGGYGAIDTNSYFVKTQDSAIWQVVFTDFVSETAAEDKGRVAFKKRKVYTPPVDTTQNIHNINLAINTLNVAPNPTYNGMVNMNIDAKNSLTNAIVTIVDINGRIISVKDVNVNAGKNVMALDLSFAPKGMYFVQLNADNVHLTTKVSVK